MGRARKFKSVKELDEAWEQYKDYCDNQEVLTHDFSSKNSEFVSATLKRSITYTIEGFCVWAKIGRANFYATYGDNPKYQDTVTRMKEECEIDARKKFELGILPTQLAGLWMNNYGYSTSQKTDITGAVPIVIADDLETD